MQTGIAQTGNAVRLPRHLTAAKLVELGASGRTGALHVRGEDGGVIYLREGEVVYAESRRTVGPVPLGTRSSLEWSLIARETMVDSVLELLSGTTGYSWFRVAENPRTGELAGAGEPASLSVGALLAEVARRQEIARQLSAIVTADTVIVRNPYISSRAIRVSDLQWALLIRVGDQSTPRRLALELGRSVFGTTVDVSRMVVLRLLSAIDPPAIDPPALPVTAVAGQSRDYTQPAISFLRAAIRANPGA